MFRSIANLFHRDELGQDVAEYCLLTALLLLIGLGIFIHLSGGIQAIWGDANTALSTTSSGHTSSGQPGRP